MRSSLVNTTLFLVLLALLTVWGSLLWFNRVPRLEVVFLDVGQGDAVYIEAPNGFQVLIDGGSGAQVLSELGAVMPWFDHSIDVVIATHPDQDHIGGLFDVVQNYQVDLVMDTGFPILDDLDAYWYQLFRELGQPRFPVMRGQELVLDPVHQVTLTFLHPAGSVDEFSDVNDGSIVARLSYGTQDFLFTGDASQLIEQQLLGDPIDAEVLKLGHHGSKTSSNELFLRKVNPAVAIISAGANNRYGHPHEIVTDRLQSLRIPVLCTCTSGRIRFLTDGRQLLRK